MSKKPSRKQKKRLAKQQSVTISDNDNTKTLKPTSRRTISTMTEFDSNFWKRNWWKGMILLLLPFLLYWQSTGYGYVLDDQIVITDNEFTKKGWAGIGDLLTTESFTGYFGEQKNLVQGNRYRPLSLITFAAEYGICNGLNPWLSHFINILLYGLTGLLVFRLMGYLMKDKVTKNWWLSIPFVISVLYILHPIHSEAVANIKGRDEILAMLLSLGTLYYSLRYVTGRRMIHMILGVATFLLALLAKENSITFLAIIPLTLYFFTPLSVVQSLKKTVPYLLVTGAYLALRFSVAGVPDFGKEIPDLMNNAFLGMTGREKMATIFYTLLKYLQLYIFPHPLSHDYYPYAIPKLGWGSWQALVALATYVGLAVVALRGWKSKSIVSYGILFFLITLTIVSNIVVNLGTFMNERFIFMASLGLTIATVYFIVEILGKWKAQTGQILATALIGILTVGYTYKTITRVPDWESALSLNKSAVEGGSNSARANSFMATALYNKAKEMTRGEEKDIVLSDAYGYATKAVNIHPRYNNANLMLAGVSAEIYKKDRNQTRLLADFKRVTERRPDISYITEYLEYLDTATPDMGELLSWYESVGKDILDDNSLHNKWALHYLLRAYNLNSNNRKVVQMIAKGYNSIGDASNAQRFQNELQNIR